MYKIIRLSALGLCLGSLLFQSCGNTEAGEKKPAVLPETTADPATPVFLLSQGLLSTTLRIPGELIAFQQVDLYAKVSSFVKKLNADVGSVVQEGQLLAVMEAPEINAQLSGAESKLKSLEAIHIASSAHYRRLLETSKTPGTVSPNDLDMAHARQEADYAQLQSAKAAYREITDTRNYLTIRAPFSGIITARNVSAGAYVGPSGKGSELPIFTLQEQKKLRLTVAVPDAYSAFINPETEVSFTVKSLTGERFTAKVVRMAGALDNRLRSQRIEMDVYNPDKKLLPGMVAEVTIPLPARDSTFLVPKTAIVNSAEGIYLLKSATSKVQKIPIRTGREEAGKVEVYGALAPGDTLVLNASEEMKAGVLLKSVKLNTNP